MIKVGIIEDNVSLLKNLNIFLGNFPDLQIVFSVSDFSEFEISGKKEASVTPDIILIDFSQHIEKMNMDFLSSFLELYPKVKLLIYTEYDDEELIVESIMKGASGYLLKSNTLYDTYSAIKECCEQGGFISSKAVLRIINYIQRKQSSTVLVSTDLSNKQKEITACLQQGLTYEEISKQLNISKFTVNYHIQKIFRKMMVKSRTELIYKLSKGDNLYMTNDFYQTKSNN
jgi:DNA-binding NarL/FixJ family response regulator